MMAWQRCILIYLGALTALKPITGVAVTMQLGLPLSGFLVAGHAKIRKKPGRPDRRL
jgi:hypothetical protein